MLVNYLIDTNVFAVYSFEKKNRNHCIALVILFVLSSVCILFFWQDDYMYDACGNAIPIRWLAPECVELSSITAVSLRSITKECNLWSVEWFNCS